MLLSVHKMPPKDYILDPGRIDIWQFPLNEPSALEKSLLCEEELARANRFHFERHRRRFISARAMVRKILAAYLRQEGSQLSFSYNKQGKPSVNNAQKLEFNLSHSADLALLAVGQAHALGIDLEFFSARPYQGIAKTLFSTQELKHFNPLPAFLQPLSFFHIWAQKEAFIKACGLGLSYPTQQFDVPILPPSDELIFDSLGQQFWQMVSFVPQLNCSAALCHHPSIKEIRYFSLAQRF